MQLLSNNTHPSSIHAIPSIHAYIYIMYINDMESTSAIGPRWAMTASVPSMRRSRAGARRHRTSLSWLCLGGTTWENGSGKAICHGAMSRLWLQILLACDSKIFSLVTPQSSLSSSSSSPSSPSSSSAAAAVIFHHQHRFCFNDHDHLCQHYPVTIIIITIIITIIIILIIIITIVIIIIIIILFITIFIITIIIIIVAYVWKRKRRSHSVRI